MPLWLSTSFINSARLHLKFSFCSIPVGCHSVALIQMIWVLFLALCSKIFFHFKTYFCLKLTFVVVVVQSLSRVWFSVTPWTAACQAIVSFTISWSLRKFMSLESVILSNHPILCHPLFLLSSIFPSVRVFFMSQFFMSGGQRIRTSASVLPKNIELISLRIDWFDLLAVQGTLKSLLQHHNLKASILQCSSAFFMIQLSHLYWNNNSFHYMDFCWPSDVWPRGFPYFLQFRSEFCNKEFMSWATVSSQSCLYWLYRASPSLAAKNVIILEMSMCRVVWVFVMTSVFSWQNSVSHCPD